MNGRPWRLWRRRRGFIQSQREERRTRGSRDMANWRCRRTLGWNSERPCMPALAHTPGAKRVAAAQVGDESRTRGAFEKVLYGCGSNCLVVLGKKPRTKARRRADAAAHLVSVTFAVAGRTRRFATIPKGYDRVIPPDGSLSNSECRIGSLVDGTKWKACIRSPLVARIA
jgi:hypothetical protein